MPHGKLLALLEGHSRGVSSVSFSPDGRLLATASHDKTARFWSVPDRKSLATLPVHTNALRLAKSVATLPGHSGEVTSVSFSPDGRLLATGSDDKTVRLWSVPDGKPLATLSGHSGNLSSVSFSPDGRLLATASNDKTARLWSVPDGKPLATLSGHSGNLSSVSFSPDGRLLLTTGGSDKTAYLWLLHRLGELNDWTLSDRSLPPYVATTLLRAGNGVVYTGDFLWAQLTVENTGQGDMARTWVEVRSESPLLGGLTAVLGKIEPGKTVERCLATLIPTETPPGEVIGELYFHEANRYVPVPIPLTFTITPLPRPDFHVSWTFVNDGSGNSHGNGDGRPKRSEYIDISVSVENQIGEDLEWLHLSLKLDSAPSGVRLTGGRHDLGSLADGETVTGRVGFCIESGAKPGLAKFELRVENKDGRTFAVVPIETSIG